VENSSDAESVHRFRNALGKVSTVARAFAEATSDDEQLLDSVARILSEHIRDACAVFLIGDDGWLQTRALHATDPAVHDGMRQRLVRSHIEPAGDPELYRVLETGEALLLAHVAAAPAAAAHQGRAQQPGLHGSAHGDLHSRMHSRLLIPLRAHERRLGVIALGRFRPTSPTFDEHDRELAQILADHASLAIQNARLHAELQGARRGAVEAEERARRSEERHRFFFESSPIPKFVFDVDSQHILAANTAALELYGYSAEEFSRLTLGQLRWPEEPGAPGASGALPDSVTPGIARHRRKDGNVLFVEGREHTILFEGQKARISVLSDQTERVKADAARRESELRLQRTLDMMMEGYTVLGPDLTYLYVNDVGARHAQLPRERLIGHTPMELYPDFESTGMYGLLMRCLRERVPMRMEEQLTLAEGNKAFFEVNIRPTAEGGLAILSIDVTERRLMEESRELLEEQLRQSQRMDAVGRLAGGVAHDFNNILSIILGYGETLLDDLDPRDPKRADVVEINKAAERAAELTKQLLMFSRQQLVEPKVLDLNDVIEDMQKMLRRLLGEHIELVYRRGDELGRIKADRGNIEQVIMNLVVNARDAMPKGGRLTIETANVVLDEAFAKTHLGTEPGAYVLVGVTDTGHGMEKPTRLRIFEPFFTTKEPGKGTGLGLSTVFGIVQQSRGCIWVSSEPGRGSTFKVYLPRTDATAELERSPAAPSTQRGTETVLLVEDEESVRSVAQRMLERNGYRVIVARDSEDALRLSDELGDQIDVLLTDVVMPRMSGAALASRLLARWPTIKVLYVSGYTDGTVMEHGVLEHGVPFLQKPFTSEQLAHKLRSVLDAPVEVGSHTGAGVA
jgi:two-component system cell cycle sensor histidine kinase/response regulator CckA